MINIANLSQLVTGRKESFFFNDVVNHSPGLCANIYDKRILVAGGAGSIGSATIMELLKFGPKTIAVLDTNENSLAELARTIHGQAQPGEILPELLLEPLDYGSDLAKEFLAYHTGKAGSGKEPFDVVMSFAALKHVRSEKDVFSTLRMLETNLLNADHFLDTCLSFGHGKGGVFFVSTDKAARPTSIMGASKRLMEKLLWKHAQGQEGRAFFPRVTTTRFANVAFSDGSLPWSWLKRIEKHQPLVVPTDVKRYMISLEEAAHLCLLSAFVCPSEHLLVPRFTDNQLVSFKDMVKALLKECREKGSFVEPQVVETVTDTSGEKPVEEFVAEGEEAIEVGLESALGIKAPMVAADGLEMFLGHLSLFIDGNLPTKGHLVELIKSLVPDFHHVETGTSLDGKR
jgi:FlaA1/EpsC-like NDP-sugar epimerase